MNSRFKFFIRRLGEQLWVKPLASCVLSIGATFIAKAADSFVPPEFFPDIQPASVKALLSTISASMLVIATFAVGSMVSSYASASNTATPRSFTLIISDDMSQNALSIFVAAFIFSVIALVTMENEYFDRSGRFALFALTSLVFAVVILTFVRWVDSIARLGRLNTTIDKIESATETAMEIWRREFLKTSQSEISRTSDAIPIYAPEVGYIKQLNLSALQQFAETKIFRIEIVSLPGCFCGPNSILAYALPDQASEDSASLSFEPLVKAFLIGKHRTFDEDPRFGLVALSEIAHRALSPAVNDPGTAIQVLSSFVRLFTYWAQLYDKNCDSKPEFHRLSVTAISVSDMFNDAFTTIARSGAGMIEISVRLQNTLSILWEFGDESMKKAAVAHSRLALARAENALTLPEDLERVREAANFF